MSEGSAVVVSAGRAERAAVAAVLLLAVGCADADDGEAAADGPGAAAHETEAGPVGDGRSGTGQPAPEPDPVAELPALPPRETLVPRVAPADAQPPIVDPGPPADERTLEHVATIRGDISPKSVVSSGRGVFFAQNMMYRHTITVYDADRELLATIPDTVDLSEFGLEGGQVRGAPVEAAFTPDGRYAYVSNYKMYGAGFDRGGGDSCSPQDGYDDSFVYRVDVDGLAIDQVIAVGSVPKYVAVTPDGRYVLVSNWCSYDLSVIDAERGEEIERIDIGRYPRGITVTSDATTAYVAVMGSTDIAVVDLDGFGVELLDGVGSAPRHLVLGPDDRFLYATLNGEGVVIRVDLASGEQARVETGQAPRSMDISADGTALYVVNYHSDTITKVRTSDLSVLQTVAVDPQPIGITYDHASGEVWVAHYSGTIRVFEDA